MSWGGEVINAYVGRQKVVFWQGRQCLSALPVDDMQPDLAEGIKQTGASPRRWLRTRVRVWLSGAIAPPFVMQPIAGLRDWREALAAAGALAADQTGWTDPTVWLDGLPVERPALAVAVPRLLLDRLNRSAAEASLTMISVRPWWALALDEVSASNGKFDLFAAEDSDALVLLSAANEQWREATSYAPKPTAPNADAVVQRRALTQGVAQADVRKVRITQFDGGALMRDLVTGMLVGSFASDPA